MNEPHLTRKLSVHQGGTKFYGVYLIHHADSGRSVTVTMHGPYKGVAPYPRSMSASRYKIECGNGDEDFHAAINTKSGRGYEVWDGGPPAATGLQDLRRHFSDNDAKAIITYLETGDTVEDNADLVEEDATFVTTPAYASAANESWGSW